MNDTIKLIFNKLKFHVLALLVLVIVACTYFSPALSGKLLKQGDITNYIGMSQEIAHHREVNGEEPLWTNSMFGGMPTYQISTVYKSRLPLTKVRNLISLWMPRPIRVILVMMFGFYFLLTVMRCHPIISATGGLAYAFSTFFIVSLEAGHNSKVMAIAFAPFVVGAFIMVFRQKRYWLGLALLTLFAALEFGANHLQVTYYLMLLLAFVGANYLVESIKNKTLGSLSIRTGGIIGAFLIAFLINAGPILNTYEYSKQTTRGGSVLTKVAKQEGNNVEKKKKGLDADYIHQWSYGIGETFTFLIPNFKGGGSIPIGKNNSKVVAKADKRFQSNLLNTGQYWGNMPFTAGTIYIGSIIIFLAFLSLFYTRNKIKWWLLVVIVLTIMLSWGKNFGLSSLFIEYFPGYNKFRSVTMIHTLTILATIWLALIYLQQIVSSKSDEKQKLTGFYIVIGSFTSLLALFYLLPDAFNVFLSDKEKSMLTTVPAEQVAQYKLYFKELASVRVAIFKNDVLRTLFFILLSGGLIFAFLKEKVNKLVFITVLFCLVGADLIPINLQYISNGLSTDKNGKEIRGEFENWQSEYAKRYPFTPNGFDEAIYKNEVSTNPSLALPVNEKLAEVAKELKKDRDVKKYISNVQAWWKYRILNQNTNYRVYEKGNPFNSSRTSYFHKSIGGYHGAKLARYQDLIENHLQGGRENPKVLNMLNTKYILETNGRMSVNDDAYGNAWLVKEIKEVKNANEEIAALNSIDPKITAVLTSDMLDGISNQSYGSDGTIEMTNYKANEINYTFNSDENAFVVFSEIYYEDNWVATIDGKETPIKRADFILRAIEVPAGEHQITMKYEDKLFNKTNKIGLFISYLFLLIILGVMIFELRRWFINLDKNHEAVIK